MALTIDAVKEEITANPEFKTQIIGSLKDEVLNSVKEEGVIIRTPEEEQEFLTNYESNIIPEKIAPRIREVHDKYDEDLFKIFGEKRDPIREKTYNFLKRKLDENIKAKLKDNPVFHDQVRELENKLTEKENWLPPDEVERIEQKYFNQTVQGQVASALEKQPVFVPEHVKEDKAKNDFAASQRSLIKSDFIKKFTAKNDNDGTIVYYEGDKLLVDNNAKPLTEEGIIKKYYSGYFVPEKIANKGIDSKGKIKQVDSTEAALKNKDEVKKYLETKEMVMGGPDFTKEYERILKEYGITE